MEFGNSLPHERRNFVHKRILGAATAFVTSGFNPVAAIGSFVAPRRAAPRAPAVQRAAARQCGAGMRLTSGGNCVRDASLARRLFDITPVGQIFGAVTGGRTSPSTALAAPSIPRATLGGAEMARGTGVAVMGRYGAGIEPDVESRVVHTCLPGMVLGDDDICYNRGQVPNKRRMWPKGRKPLLTGGEMNCITKAARAANRIKATQKKLKKLGLLK